jgi:type-F conjugative transfer system pilin assembly protein TrbC
VESADALQKRITELGLTLERLRNPHHERAQTEAARALSEGYRLRMEEEADRLLQDVFGDALGDHGEVCETAEPPLADGILPDSERLYLFISSSMPLNTLRNYARAIDHMGDPRIVMVLRGFVGGMQHVLPTQRFVLDVLQKNSDCDPDTPSDGAVFNVNLIIDPLLFRRFGVEHVPTLVYAIGLSVKGGDFGSEGLPETAQVAHHVAISGDAALDYLLDRIQLETQSPALVHMVTTLRGLRE